MTRPELPEPYNPLNPHLAAELIAPGDQWHPFGEDDALSHYIYEPMREARSTDKIIELIDYTESTINTTETNNEDNQLKISRLAALVADLPEELPLEERTRAWRHLINADWVHLFGDTHDFDRVITTLAREDAAIGSEIRKVQRSVFEKKLAALNEKIGDDPRIPRLADGKGLFVPRYVNRNAWFEQAMGGYDPIRKNYPDELPLYNSLVVLSMSDHRLTHSS